MNTAAYGRIQKLAAPLASRIGDRIILLKPLKIDSAKAMIGNYLSLARTEQGTDKKLYPFTDDVIDFLLSVKETTMQGSPRFLVQSCYTLLQRASEELEKGDKITREFAKKVFKDKVMF